jgi:hypothetical protein
MITPFPTPRIMFRSRRLPHITKTINDDWGGNTEISAIDEATCMSSRARKKVKLFAQS